MALNGSVKNNSDGSLSWEQEAWWNQWLSILPDILATIVRYLEIQVNIHTQRHDFEKEK